MGDIVADHLPFLMTNLPIINCGHTVHVRVKKKVFRTIQKHCIIHENKP